MPGELLGRAADLSLDHDISQLLQSVQIARHRSGRIQQPLTDPYSGDHESARIIALGDVVNGIPDEASPVGCKVLSRKV